LLFNKLGRLSPTVYTSKPQLLHYEEIHISDISFGYQKHDVNSEEIILSIKCFGKNVTLDLVKNRELFTEKAKVSVYGGNDLLYSYVPPLNAYKEKINEQFFSRITVLNYDEIKVKGAWSTGDDIIYIDPVEEHFDNLKRHISSLTHVIYRDSDYSIRNPLNLKKRDILQTNTTNDIIPQVLAATSYSPPPSPCPQTVKGFIQSVAADYRYVNKNGGEAGARNTITNNWNTIQALYINTVNIKIMLDEIVLMTQVSPSTPEWNIATCPTIDIMLGQVSSWRGTRNNNAGLWHLLTDCYPPPGTIGLAWVGVTCLTSGGSYSGTGVSTYLSGMNGYRVSAHEIGHNFGSQHEVDGLMVPSLKAIDYFSQVTQSQICQHIQSTTYQCYKDIVTTPVCTPQCTGKTCGSNVCGGSCGTCNSSSACNSAGICQATCIPNCAGKNCGSNGCGGSCGSCPSTMLCNSVGVCQCNPQCSGKNCGSNGCGGTCGTCSSSMICNSLGICQSSTCVPNCAGKNCGLNGCGGSCGTCNSTSSCNSIGVCQCNPQCSGKTCGSNGCGGTCGTCPSTSICTSSGICQSSSTCIPQCSGKNCGSNGCGGTCGTCSSSMICNSLGICQTSTCVPNCAGKNCGSNGCGGSCGTCSSTMSCNSLGICQTTTCMPNCTGRNCGLNNCGTSCGTCSSTMFCNSLGICQLPTCMPNCYGRTCGPDGCGTGGICGTCNSMMSCNIALGICQAPLCVPNCNGRNCGSNGCGGTCGTCPTSSSCNINGLCQSLYSIFCIPNCIGRNCGPDDCGGTCGTCSNLKKCDLNQGNCVAAAPLCMSQCNGKQCGDDGCGDSCGSCNGSDICSSGLCKFDTSQSDEELLKEFILDSHNSIRLRKHVSLLTWSTELADIANDWTKKCEYGNNINAFAENIGENIAVGNESSTIEQLFENWLVEELNYDCTNNRCFGPCTNYLQVVSEGATEIGCAIKTCASERGPASGYQNPPKSRNTYKGPTYPGYSGTNFPGFPKAYPWFDGSSFPQNPRNPFAPNFPGTSTDYGDNTNSENPFYPTPGYPGDSVNQDSSSATTKIWKYLVCNYSPKVNLNAKSVTCDTKCEPNVTCESQGRICGYIYDGCKPVYCGDCPVGGRCESDGLCKCIPFTNCKLSNSCTKIFDGCNWIDCQSECNETKNENVCTPSKQCPTFKDKQVCGTLFNGCEKIECGSCTSGQQCINYTCTNCSNCHMMAQCIDDTCKCLPGHIGNGIRCLPLSNTLTSSLSDWKEVKGNTADWKIDYNFLDNRIEISNFGKNSSIISWTNSDKLGQNTNLTFTVDIQPLEGAREWGIIFRQIGDNYLKFSYKESNFVLSIVKENVIKEQIISILPGSISNNWAKNSWKTISVISDGIYHKLFVDGYWIPELKYWKVPNMEFGRVGLYADGATNFRNVLLFTKSSINLKLYKCVDKNNFINLIRNILDIRGDQITDFSHNCNNKKRDVTSFASVTFSILGGPMISSTALTSQLIGRIAASHASISSSIIIPESPIIHSINENEISLISEYESVIKNDKDIIIITGVAGGITLIVASIILIVLLRKPKPPVDSKEVNIEKVMHEMAVDNISSSNEIKSKGVNVDPITMKKSHLSISARFPPTEI
jgi:hypothetical protein